MENKKYESPKFEFQEMKLMERVADKCWGNGYAFVDGNKDGDFVDEGEKYTIPGGGCEGNNPVDLDARLALFIKSFPELKGVLKPGDVSTNVKASRYVRPDPNPS